MEIECADRLGVLLERPKRVKILVGGRASTKSTFVSDVVLAKVAAGEKWCCAREFQNSIDDSVHSLLTDEIERLKFPAFNILKTEITHASSGRIFYRGLARNITSLKGINANGLWIEEGESLSEQTIKVLTASIRRSAKQQADDSLPPEIWVTMNRGSSLDPIAEKFLSRAEADLSRCGFYEDAMMMVIQINYDENPWFEGSGLEAERQDDQKYMSKDEYEHKWLGAYSDTIEGNTIKKEWFDSAVDAHIKLNITPRGATIVAHDPADEGGDSKAYAVRHGILVTDVGEIEAQTGNEACDEACRIAIDRNADLFVWDADGMGALLRRQIGDAFEGIRCDLRAYHGSHAVEDKDQPYDGLSRLGDKDNPKTNDDTFYNKRAQTGMRLAQRFYNTWEVVELGKYHDPDDLISVSSEIKLLNKLRSEVCRIPRKKNNSGKIQLKSKQEMWNQHKIASPGMYDCLTMALEVPCITGKKPVKINFRGWS